MKALTDQAAQLPVRKTSDDQLVEVPTHDFETILGTGQSKNIDRLIFGCPSKHT